MEASGCLGDGAGKRTEIEKVGEKDSKRSGHATAPSSSPLTKGKGTRALDYMQRRVTMQRNNLNVRPPKQGHKT